MLKLLALFCPGLALMLSGRVFSGLIFIPLQITVIGWLLGVFYAWSKLSQDAWRKDCIVAATAAAAASSKK